MQDLANTAWAFATANQCDAQLFAALARAAEWRVSSFNVRNLSNTVWAFATVNQTDDKLFTASAVAAEQRAGDFSEQGFANVVWAPKIVGKPRQIVGNRWKSAS